MGHCAYQFSVLDDGAAAHALDDAAGQVQQRGVGHLEDDALCPVAAGLVHFSDLDLVVLYRPGYAAAQKGWAYLHILAITDRDRLTGDAGAQVFSGRPEYARLRIGIDLSQERARTVVDHTAHHTGRTGIPPLDPKDLGLI